MAGAEGNGRTFYTSRQRVWDADCPSSPTRARCYLGVEVALEPNPALHYQNGVPRLGGNVASSRRAVVVSAIIVDRSRGMCTCLASRKYK